MEQRSPGHTVLGDVIYRKGLADLKTEVAESLARLDFFNDPEATTSSRRTQGHWAGPRTP